MITIMNLLKIWGKIILLVAGAVSLYAYAMFQGGFVSWFLLYSFLPFLFYSILIAFYSFKFWKIERAIDEQLVYEAGDTVKVQIKITRSFPFPLYYLIIKDTFSVGEGQEKRMLFPLFKRKFSVAYELTELPRGEHIFKEITVASADFLGLIRKENSFKVENKVIVYPKRQRLNLFFLEKHVGAGTLARGLDDKKETMIPTSIREYERGDRLSWINWKMTAKKSTLISKEFERTEDHRYFICMDRANQINPAAFEKIVHYTASLTEELYKAGHPFNLLSCGAERTIFLYKKSAEWRNQVLYHLAIIKNDSNYLLSEVLEREKAELPEKGTLIVVTDHMNPQLFERMKTFANKERKIIIILSLVDHIQKYGKQLINQNITIRAMDEELAFGTAGVKTND
ncbi:MAG TPA: DUF58 domain-containing protein [Bacillus bacterium]|nr:DUF58 domain-containing protein [Bacillus sp. (in: firmicutes)]